MSFITQDATLQNEILNLNQSVIDNFSVIQEFLQSNLDTLTLSNELAQAAIDWDLPTQFEDLKNRYDLALFSAVEGLTTFLGEASALQNELQAANNETNLLTLGELLALNNESLLQSLGELLALNSETILLSLSEMLNTHILSLLNAVALLDINNTAALLEIGTSLSTNNTTALLALQNAMAANFVTVYAAQLNSINQLRQLQSLISFSTATETVNLSALAAILTMLYSETAIIRNTGLSQLATSIAFLLSLLTIETTNMTTGLTTLAAINEGNQAKSRIEGLLTNGKNTLLQIERFLSSQAINFFRSNQASFADIRSLLSGEILKKLSDDRLAREANDIARQGNRLAIEANNIARANLIISTALSVLDIFNPFATGGFPATGQLFIAREAGPELVGSIGGRSAVVNNNQIVEAVSNGVARAVAAVMGQGAGQSIQVFIGNEQLDRYIVRSQRRQALRTNGAYL